MIPHAVVWLDHSQARVFHVADESSEELTVKPPKHHLSSSHPRETHHHRGESRETSQFFESIARAISDVQEILVLGPGSAKVEFVKHVTKHEPKLAARFLGIETSDHPTDAQIVAHAREFFRKADRMLGTHV